MSFEKIRSQNKLATATEVAALGYLAWQLRNRYWREQDDPSKPDPGDYPLVEAIDGVDLYINPGPNDTFTLGEVHPDTGLLELNAHRDETGKFAVDSASDIGAGRLSALLQRFRLLNENWMNRSKHGDPS